MRRAAYRSAIARLGASLAATLFLLCPTPARAHGEIAGGGTQTFSKLLEGQNGKYHIELMYSPSLPTAGEPANVEIKLMRLLPKPDPLLGSEAPIGLEPEASLVYADTQRVVVPHLPVHTEGEAGIFGIAEYQFPQSGSFLLRFVVRSETGDELTVDFPITVKANAAAFFRLWVNLAVGALILGLTGMQLWRVRASGAPTGQMIRPAAIGLVSLVVVVLAMDYFILGAVLDLRKPEVGAVSAAPVTVNEDGSYVIPANVQQELGITLADVKQVALDQTASAFGVIQARPDLTAEVQAQLWGRIEFPEKPLAVGDAVRRGQTLAVVILELSAFERGPMEAKDLDIKGALKKAEERRQAAQLQYERAQKLHAANPAFEADVKWAKELLDEATSIRDEMKKQDEQFQAVMKFRDPRRTPVQSPINGVITTIDFVPGELNATDEYRRLFTVVDPSRVWARADVYVNDVWKLKKGQSVRVIPASAAARPATGAIHWIGDTLDPVNRTVPVIVDLPNEGRTFALGSFARMEFQQQQRVLAVPEQAVVDVGTARWVYVAREGETFAVAEVEMGLRQNGWWQVLSGLEEGDRVIAKGAALLGSMSGSMRRPEIPPESAAVSTSYPAGLSEASVATKP
ncbi:MAG TPA: efflux RND transporter periplasmic adaptor subunit [Terriglobia bacterium]|jgi:RND family efflux transporter MFP subunit